MNTTRRGFLSMLGLGAAAVAVEPVRRFWQVGVQLESGGSLYNGSGAKLHVEHGYTYAGGSQYVPTINAYVQGDPHTQLAAQMLKLPVEEAMKHPRFKEFRHAAKELNFGFTYGASRASWAQVAGRLKREGQVTDVEIASLQDNLRRFWG